VARYACLLVLDLPLAAVLRAEPELRAKPVAVVEEGDERATILAGWMRGLTVAQARTVEPDLIVRPLSVEGIRSTRESLLDVAHSVTPRVEDTTPGIVFLDLDGTQALFPSERGLRTALETRLGEVGLGGTRIGIGPTRTVARFAARYRDGGHIVPADTVSDFLETLPVDLLEPPEEEAERLTRWGIRTLGELANLPLDALGARLGEEGVQLARRARGEDPLPFRPTPLPLRFEEGTETEYPVGNLEALAFFLRGVLDRLTRRLRLRGLAARELHLEFVLESGKLFARPVRLSAPTFEVPVLLSLVRLALEREPPGELVERVRIIATPSSVETAQLDLFLPPLPAPAELAVTVARLEALCGPGRVGAPGLEDTHRPEAERVDVFSHASNAFGIARRPTSLGRSPSTPSMALRALRPPVPVRVYGTEGLPDRVEPLEAARARELAGGRILHRAGPWRLYGEWWGESRFARDYFDVELSDGGIYRLYRNLENGGWFVDGIYD
jgi:protein ImuB